ncbi:MAG: DNA translocase FtsK 4TM domain-containing protein [Caldicoprobacterales bacterium]|jgi:S-DNA-T family DNA segregation ATPase FtsK/SpoIIIE
MARKMAKTKKKRGKDNRKYELIGIVIIGLGVFSLLSIYTSSAGIVGLYFGRILRGLFGIIAYIMPPIIILTGILTIMTYHKTVNKAKLGLTILSIFLIFQLVHLIYINNFSKADLSSFVIDSYNLGIDNKGAGALVSPLVYYIAKWFGIMGGYLFLIVLFIIDLLLLTNLSLKQLGINVYGKISEKKNSLNRSNSNGDRMTKTGKPFIGEVIELEPEINGKVDPQHLQDAFKNNQGQQQDQAGTDDDIKIIEYDKRDEEISDVRRKKPRSSTTEKDSKDTSILDSQITGAQVTDYSFPPITLLEEPEAAKESKLSGAKVRNNAKLLEDTLMSFGISAKVLQVSKGPAITRYELQPAPGVKVSRIVNLSDDIALNLASPGVRIEAPIPGKAAIGVEVPNKDISVVRLREVLESSVFLNHPSKISFGLGKDIAGKSIVADIARMPHLLIAGATGSGKSVCINSLIVSILYKASPKDVRLILIDPKVVELNHFNGIPHLLIPVVTDPKKASGALNWAVVEMTNRYKLFAKEGVKDLQNYNSKIQAKGQDALPQIVVVVDELADLMMVAPGDVEDAICRLAQMARAAGIHLVIATQRPSVDVITGLIKANIPSRIAFAVSSNTDSRTILDVSGAEKLLGRGDMLFYPVGASKPIRVQGCYVSENEITNIVDYIRTVHDTPTYDLEVIEEIAADREDQITDEYDELLPEAISIVIDAGQASISMLQRRLRIGYARAARMIDEMEIRGIVSGFDGSKPRNVLISREEFEEEYVK